LNFLDSPGALFCSSGKALCLLLAAAAAGTPSQAAPLDELRSLSQLQNVDLAKLKRGEIASARGPVGDFPRGIHLECCYFIHAPMNVVGRAASLGSSAAKRIKAVVTTSASSRNRRLPEGET
jgi:hypothetical protein